MRLVIQDNQKGAASIFIVAFFTLLLTVLTVSFSNIVIQDQRQALNNDLSQSAYDSASAGTDDAIRVLKWYGKNCIDAARVAVNAPDCVKIEEGEKCNIQNLSEAKREEILPGVTFENDEVILSQSENDTLLDQAYSCASLATVTDDVKTTLTDGKSNTLIPLKTLRNEVFDSIQLNWYTVGFGKDVAKDATILGSTTELPQSNAGGGDGAWGGTKPPIIRFEIIPTTRGNINIAATELGTRTLFLYPSSGGSATVDVVGSDARFSAKASAPTPVRCNSAAPEGGYVCSVTLNNLNSLAGGSAATEYFVRMTSLYNDADVQMKLYDGSTLVSFDNVSPQLDATGRAGDVYRRVQTRVITPMPNSPIKDGGFDITQGLCKNFHVPVYSDGCPVGSGTRFDE